jgi:DNA-directed RNA polymerase subunit D
MAITEVLFVENDSVIYDEILAHRLGLIPITTDLKNYNMPHECSCGGTGCSLCQVEFTLENKSNGEERYAYTRDMISRDPKVKAVKDDIIIAKLGKTSSLVFEAYAQLGQGKDHAKFQPVCTIGYKYYPDVKIDNSKFKNADEMKKVADLCHAHVMEVKDGKLNLVENYVKKCDLCAACDRAAPKGAIKVSYTPNKFIFTIEGTGAHNIQDVLSKAVQIFLEKADEFEERINKAKITIRPDYLK